jgi:hypothetical protein
VNPHGLPGDRASYPLPYQTETDKDTICNRTHILTLHFGEATAQRGGRGARRDVPLQLCAHGGSAAR